MVGETMMDLFTFMQQNLNKPIDTFELMQRITIEVLGKLAFGYRFGVSMGNIFLDRSFYSLFNKKYFRLVFRFGSSSYYKHL